MKAFVITLENNQYSVESANRCIQSAKQFGQDVEIFHAVHKDNAYDILKSLSLPRWTWAGNNDTQQVCSKTGLKQFPYNTDDIRKKIGCTLSHYLLWEWCVKFDEPILILEHDAVFVRPLPDIQFEGICQINDPSGCTPRGRQWSETLKRKGEGVHKKTVIFNDGRPDGLAGNSAYVIKPWAAKELINKTRELGIWPNDAIMCRQLFPYLEEYYPFVTIVNQGQSTTVG